MDTIRDPVQFLVDNGILFEMNRQVLHPLGFQLEIEMDGEGRVSRFDLLDNRASPEPVFFSPEDFEEGRKKYESYMEEHGKRNVQKRRRTGVVIQTGPTLSHRLHDDEEEEP